MPSRTKTNRQLTRERACELFSYDPETGIVTRKTNRGGSLAGSTVGTLWSKRSKRYFRAVIDYRHYQLHRVIWLMQTGEWPNQIDHINHDGLDNRWANLRDVDSGENARNISLPRNNRSGIVGVTLQERDKLWISHITCNGERQVMYYGKDFFEACCARKSAEVRLGFHENHGMSPVRV